MEINVRFNCLKKENIPVRKKGGWFDIPLPYDLCFKAGKVVKIVFDLRVEMPDGYEAIVQPRSSTLERYGLISSGFGVIEDCYCGKDDYIGYRFYATKDGVVTEGSCLVQMRFQKKMRDVKMVIMPDNYFNSKKNRGGFGSTDSAQNSHINQLDWEPEETEYQQGYSTGFDEGHMDGYEEGFRDGYDRCIEDLKLKFNEQKV